MPRELAPFIAHPVFERGNQWRHPRLPHGTTMFCRQPIDRALDAKDRIDAAHRFDRQRRLRDIGQDEQLAPPVCPARRLDDRAGLSTRVVEIVEPGIGVRLQDPAVGREMPTRMPTAAIARVEEDRRRR
jgi:hypothetical protein